MDMQRALTSNGNKRQSKGPLSKNGWHLGAKENQNRYWSMALTIINRKKIFMGQ